MGIQTSKTVYKSDRGQEFELETMQSSHILNVMRLHNDQYRTLCAVIQDNPGLADNANLKARAEGLENTLEGLIGELSRRHPNDDLDFEVSNHDHHDHY